jgi:hypothetical protein
LRTRPASKPKNPIRATRIRSGQAKFPYTVVASKYPEQKSNGHAKENWSRVRSIYALRVAFIAVRCAFLALTRFDKLNSTRYLIFRLFLKI